MIKKKVFVNGYVDTNLGDDIFFDLLLTRYPQADFYFNTKDIPKNLKKYPNAKIVFLRDKNLFSFLSKIDVYLLIGGSMFQESSNLGLMIKKWIKVFFLFLYLHIKHVDIACIGFNFGPIRTKLFLFLYRILFEIPDYLSVRDMKTFNLFKNNSRFHYYPDMVFGISDSYLTSQKNQSLGVSIMDFGTNIPFQEEYNQFIIKLLNCLDDSIDINIYAFQNTKDISDSTIISNVLSNVNKDINVILYDGNNMKEFLQSYGANAYAITTRFHSLVLSLLNRQKVLSIEYNIKVTNLLSMVNINDIGIPISIFSESDNASHYANKINAFFKEEKNLSSKVKYNSVVESYKDKASRHFEYLDYVLLKK